MEHLYCFSLFLVCFSSFYFYYDVAAVWYQKEKKRIKAMAISGAGALGIIFIGIPWWDLILGVSVFHILVILILAKGMLHLKMAQCSLYTGFFFTCMLTILNLSVFCTTSVLGTSYSGLRYQHGYLGDIGISLTMTVFLWICLAMIPVFRWLGKRFAVERLQTRHLTLIGAGFLMILSVVVALIDPDTVYERLGLLPFYILTGCTFVFGMLLRYDFEEGAFRTREFRLLEQKMRNEILEKELWELEISFEQWRTSVHDYKNSILYLVKLAEENNMKEIRRYLSEESQKAEQRGRYYRTGNIMMDVIVNTKYQIASNKGISFVLSASLPEELNISEKHLGILLGNLYDNAIEAAQDCKEGYVSLSVWTEHRMLEIEMINSYTGERNLDFSTTKANPMMHGLGLRSVQNLVNQYDGKFSVRMEQGEAVVLVELPFEKA